MEQLNKIFKRIKTFFTSGSERSVVVVCFLLSTLFWVLIKFSKEYTYYIDYPIEIVNQPIEKCLKEQSQSSLKIKVKGFGFSFLKENFVGRNIEVDVSKLNYSPTKNAYFWLSEPKLPEMAIELSGFSIMQIEPDTLFLTYSNNTKKTVEVKVPLDLEFRENYIQYSSLKIDPVKIDVFGPSHLVDTLTVLYTEPLVATDVVEDVDKKLQLVFPDNLLSARETQIGVHLDVERFTQINKVVPIRLKNSPKGSTLSLKPSEVELSFWIAMQDVDKVSDSDFYIYCDYNEVLKTKSSLLNVFIDEQKYPSIVKRVKYSPTTIEFVDY